METSIKTEINAYVKRVKELHCEEDYYLYFEQRNIEPENAIRELAKVNTLLSMYVIIQILGNESIYTRLHWEKVKSYKYRNIQSISDYNCELFKYLKPNLLGVVRTGILAIQKLMHTPVKDLSYEEFKNGFEPYVQRKKSQAIRNSKITIKKNTNNSSMYSISKMFNTGDISEKFEYGLSDW